jgi:hypothetical protein
LANDLFDRHVSRLKASLSAHSADTIVDFIVNHTKLNGKPFTFEGHEYQKRILEDKAQNIVIMKSAQIGISEMSARLALAKCALIDGFSTIYTLPSASAAANFMKTRIDPIITNSEYLKDLISSEVDNVAVKQLGNSWLYMRGCQVDRQAISIPADCLITDEVDNSDISVMTLYNSRLIHSKYANTVALSTPTVPGYGISLMFAQSKRKLNLCKCEHCATWFAPDYFEHVVIPGFDDRLDKVTKLHFADPKFRWGEAYLACPKCGKPANLQPEHREWVEENPDDAFVNSGYRVTPFDCPTIIKMPTLVKSSTEYERFSDFANQRLGIAMEDAEISLTREDIVRSIITQVPEGGYSYCAGIDVGNTCWISIGQVYNDNSIVVVHVEPVPFQKMFERYAELSAKYRLRSAVIDAGPLSELVFRLQQTHRNMFASVYVQSKTVELFVVKDREESVGKMDVRQVNVHRNNALSLSADMVKAGYIQKVSDEHDNVWISHMMSQKRIKQFVNNELTLNWVKTNGQDHLHHSVTYLLIASRLLGLRSGFGGTLPLFNTMTLKPQDVDMRGVRV